MEANIQVTKSTAKFQISIYKLFYNKKKIFFNVTGFY